MNQPPPVSVLPPVGAGDGGSAARIAREALQQMVAARVAPTPENYRIYYHRIQGTLPEEAFPERHLRALAKGLPRHTPQLLKVAQLFDAAVASAQWPDFQRAMGELAQAAVNPADALPWLPLLKGLADALARAGNMDRVAELQETLANVRATPDSLHASLTRQIAAWAEAPAPGKAPPAAGDAVNSAVLPLLQQLFAQVLPGVLSDCADLAEESRRLAALFVPSTEFSVERVSEFQAFLKRLEGHGEDALCVRQSLVRVLQLIVSNIAELVLDDRWLHGQLTVLQEAFSRPLDIRTLDELERRLVEVIDKQRHLKRQLTEAQERLKSMLAGFVDRLASFSDATGSYHEILERCAQRIQEAESLENLSEVVEEMLTETRTQKDNAQRSHEELAELRVLVESANQQILRLQRELDETSELVRHDPLTGVLNRKGLDETLEREIQRARRGHHSLCVSLIDVDDFKQINDTLGHQTGDQALRHLARVIKDSLRGNDFVGRLGGEEFLVILPDTPLDEGVNILVRLQRELTRRFFLADDRRLLITFSAGVAQLGEDEVAEMAVDRADHAMYLAKRAGKNRVFAA